MSCILIDSLWVYAIMGRRSPESKKKLRNRQKKKRIQRRKQKSGYQEANSSGIDAETNISAQKLDSQFLSPSELIDQEQYPTSDEETYGIDLDVLEMTMPPMEDDDDESVSYLLKCRERLISKVKKYKENYEMLITENIKLKAKHGESIRSFYTNISFGLSRSGQIVRTALCNNMKRI